MYTVYKITNAVTNRYYIGVHRTSNPHDAYLGSGTLIRRAVAKYGVSNFQKEILFTFEDAESAFHKEEEVVQQHRDNPLCYNLRKGGKGGFDWINQKGLNRDKSDEAKRNMSASAKRRVQTPEGRSNLQKNGFLALKQGAFIPGRPSDAAREKIRLWAVDRKASLNTRRKMSEAHKHRTPEFNSWCVRKRWAAVKGLLFFEPKPAVYGLEVR